jgi:hypothetical protein
MQCTRSEKGCVRRPAAETRTEMLMDGFEGMAWVVEWPPCESAACFSTRPPLGGGSFGPATGWMHHRAARRDPDTNADRLFATTG